MRHKVKRRYAVHHLINIPNESDITRMNKIMKEAFEDKDTKEVSSYIYYIDFDEHNFPLGYKLMNKKDIYEDFPYCKKVRIMRWKEEELQGMKEKLPIG